MGTLEQLVNPFMGAGVMGLVSRVLLLWITSIQKRKDEHEKAIAIKVSDGKMVFNTDGNTGGWFVINFVAVGMFVLLFSVTLLFACYPQAEFTVYLPETLGQSKLELFFFSKSWSSNLGDSVLVLTSGGLVYQMMIFSTYVVAALFKVK